MRRRARAVCVAVLLFAAGCRTETYGPTSANRAAFGDMAVVLVDDGVRDMERPVTRWTEGLGMGTMRGLAAIPAGAALGAFAVVVGGGAAAGPWFPVVVGAGALAGAAVGAVYTPISMIGGAVSTASEDDVAAAEPSVRAVLGDPALAQPLQDAFTEAAHRLTGRSFTDPEHANCLVELRLAALRGRTRGVRVSYDPPVSIVAETGARVIRRRDGVVLWTWTRASGRGEDDAPALRFAEWGANGGEPLRAEVRRALHALGRAYASLVFVDPPAPVPPSKK